MRREATEAPHPLLMVFEPLVFSRRWNWPDRCRRGRISLSWVAGQDRAGGEAAMNRSGDSRLVLVRRCTPGLILAVSFGLFLIAGGSVVAQGNGTAPAASSLLPGAREDYVDSGGVRIHCVSLGRSESPLLVLIHGFPDFWYSWRAQMPALARDFHVVAIDQRGYNLSGQPEGVE